MRLALIALGSLLILALPSQHQNPPVAAARTIESRVEMPLQVRSILEKSCNDCHSNNTHWPWYANLPLASKLIEDDVKQSRSLMNFSEWPDSKGLEIGLLLATCADVKNNRMPPQKYRTMHPSTHLTSEEQSLLCNWTMDSIRKLRSQ